MTESQILHSSRGAFGRALTASPAAGVLFWLSHLPCQTLALHSSLDSLSPLPNLPGSGILYGQGTKEGRSSSRLWSDRKFFRSINWMSLTVTEKSELKVSYTATAILRWPPNPPLACTQIEVTLLPTYSKCYTTPHMKKANRLQNSTHMHDSIKVKQGYFSDQTISFSQVCVNKKPKY